MRQDVLYALILFCFVSGVTPGPNNLMLMTSGVNFGFRRTLPHLMGVVPRLRPDGRAGRRRTRRDLFASSGAAADDALGRRRLYAVARLAHRHSGRSGRRARGRPLGFFGAAAFQWINPKAWVIAVSALTAYAVCDNYARSVASWSR